MKDFEEYLDKMGYGWNDFDRTYEMANLIEQYADEKVNQALTIPAVVGQSEQLCQYEPSFRWWSTDDLIDCLPQNRPLYKDSGLWQIRTDDMENIYMQQNCNEPLRGFIIRYLEWLEEHEDIAEVRIDLSLRDMQS